MLLLEPVRVLHLNFHCTIAFCANVFETIPNKDTRIQHNLLTLDIFPSLHYVVINCNSKCRNMEITVVVFGSGWEIDGSSSLEDMHTLITLATTLLLLTMKVFVTELQTERYEHKR